MNNLLIFFAIPLATIIISVVLERIWNNYILVTAFAFAIFLIVAFTVGDTTLLVLVIIYTLLAFIASFLSMLFRRICRRLRNIENTSDENEETNCRCRQDSSNNCNNSSSQNVAFNANITPNLTNNGRTGTFRGQYRRRF